MTAKITPEASLAARSPVDEYSAALASQMPELDRLFQGLEKGATPNFLDIMAGISEMVAFYTKERPDSAASKILEEKMSGKFCRFCS